MNEHQKETRERINDVNVKLSTLAMQGYGAGKLKDLHKFLSLRYISGIDNSNFGEDLKTFYGKISETLDFINNTDCILNYEKIKSELLAEGRRLQSQCEHEHGIYSTEGWICSFCGLKMQENEPTRD